MSEAVELDRVVMRFGDFTAVHETNLKIEAGEFFSFLGPSGCGKTTLLRLIAGFIEPTSGRVLIGGRDMRGIGPNKRPTAMIFQNLALFPLMSVADNIAFGLEVRGVDKSTRRKRAQELLELIALPDAGDKRVADLSGGQKQRVAIARALAVEPAVLLLDEPLSALDLKLRQHMRHELRSLQKRTGVTFIYITHDQGEALTMSDRVAVMSAGRIEQVAAPEEIYAAPATPFVAGFVGEINRFSGRVASVSNGEIEVETPLGRLRGRARGVLSQGENATLFVRPERMLLGANGANSLSAAVVERNFEGSFVFLIAEQSGQRVVVQLLNGGETRAPGAGEPVQLHFAPGDAVVLRG